MVLDEAHDLSDTSVMVLEERGSHNWVEAVEGKCFFFNRKVVGVCLTRAQNSLGFSPETEFLDTNQEHT